MQEIAFQSIRNQNNSKWGMPQDPLEMSTQGFKNVA